MSDPNPDPDPFRLARFLEAQARNHADALAELRDGRKRSHWMWYVFPQLAGLGLSPTAQFYGIGSADEARAYLAHPLLGPRLLETTRAVLGHPGRSLHAIFGSPDDMKFCSSMTLFACAADAGPPQVGLPPPPSSGRPPSPAGGGDAAGAVPSPLPPGEGDHAQHGGEGTPAGGFAPSVANPFHLALATFCGGAPCPRTLELLAKDAR